MEFNERSMTVADGCDGSMCMLTLEFILANAHDHGDGHGHHHRRDSDHDPDHENCTSCFNMYELCHDVILSLGLTTQECFNHHPHNDTQRSNKPTTAQGKSKIGHSTLIHSSFFLAYGYGFLMISLVALCALIGIFLVPIIRNNSQGGRLLYEYTYAFIFAIGISALLSDAILHLIPHVSTLHFLNSL